jgi:hypothetical protein
MTLLIYEFPTPSSEFSIDSLFVNPLSMSFDGITGSTRTKKYYVRNSDAAYTYSGITLTPVDSGSPSIVDGTNGFSWKLIAGDSQPLEEQWTLITSPPGTIVIPDISDISTYQPFWLRITVPKGASVETHSLVKLRLDYTQTLVP